MPYQSITAPIHGSLLPRAIAVAAVGRILTAPPVGRTVAGGWSIFWNDLLAGARPGSGRRLAATAATLGGLITGPGRTKRWFSRSVATEDSVGG
ncbi:MAG: hypothetical protein JOZ04_00500 [Acidimicrobiia bacterium]|nr:hypothetical protein [Acidimicrobiia bacterium]